jgi:3-deoxy-7-phosphoheptulonate synthase
MSAIIRTTGNSATHVVLRGGRNPNYDNSSIAECVSMLERSGLEPRVLVDCSHAQTNKDFRKQPLVFDTLVAQICGGSRAIMGMMVESNLEAGSQPINSDRSKLKYGVSVTDPCIDWRTTEQCLHAAAAVLSGTRAAASAG